MEQANTVILDLEEYKKLYDISKLFEKKGVLKQWYDYEGAHYTILENDEAIKELTEQIDIIKLKYEELKKEKQNQAINLSCEEKKDCKILNNVLTISQERAERIYTLENELKVYRKSSSNKRWFNFELR